jgi:hypothetical protein
MPAMVCFFSCLACRYPLYEPAYLNADTSMMCWTGRHVYVAGAAAVLIVLTFTTQMFIVTMRQPLRVTLYRLDALFEAPFLCCKTAMVAAGVLLRHKWAGRGVVYPMLGLTGGLLVFAFRNQPVRVRWALLSVALHLLPLTAFACIARATTLHPAATPPTLPNSTPSPGGCSGQRACQHAELGIPEMAHGPTLESRQLPQHHIRKIEPIIICFWVNGDHLKGLNLIFIILHIYYSRAAPLIIITGARARHARQQPAHRRVRAAAARRRHRSTHSMKNASKSKVIDTHARNPFALHPSAPSSPPLTVVCWLTPLFRERKNASAAAAAAAQSLSHD